MTPADVALEIVVAQRWTLFTVDDLRGQYNGVHPSTWGAALVKAQRDGKVRRVGPMVRSPKSRRLVPLWTTDTTNADPPHLAWRELDAILADCPACDAVAQTWRGMKQHMRTAHGFPQHPKGP